MKTAAKDFKMTELGPIPKDWDVKRLGDVAPLQRGFDLPTAELEDGPYPVVYSNGIGNYHRKAMCDAPGLVTGRSGTIGHFTYIAEGRYWPHNTALWVTSFNGNHPLFVKYLYETLGFENFSTGTGVPTLNRNIVHDYLISLPPLPEQRKIAAALSDVDEMIAALEKLIEKKRKIKIGAMQRLLTGKTRLPGFKGAWVEKRLGDCADIRTGKRNGDEQTPSGMYPFFVRSQVVYRIDSYSFDGEAILVPGEGGIGSIFHYINGKFDYHQRVYKISDFTDGVFGKFLFHYLKRYFGEWALSQTVKATVDSLRLPTFENFIMIVPPSLAEQKAIAKVLGDMDEEIAALEAELAKTRQLKQGMMQELLTGKVRLV